jgi:hypothetical protein
MGFTPPLILQEFAAFLAACPSLIFDVDTIWYSLSQPSSTDLAREFDHSSLQLV